MICPECVSGKHTNCDGTSWDNAADAPCPCPCAEAGHCAEDRAALIAVRSVLCQEVCDLYPELGVCGVLCQQKRWEIIDRDRECPA